MLAHYPMVKVIPQATNLGFTKCANIGLSASTGQYITLLNPDTEILDDTLLHCVKFLEQNPKVGIMGPQIVNSDGTPEPERRQFPTLKHEILRYSPLKSFSNHRNNDKPVQKISCDAKEVDWVKGCAMVIRREVYNTVGCLDEEFVMYYEEIDYCLRTRKAGWGIILFAGATILHHRGQSSKQVPAQSRYHHKKSQLTYFRKHHSKLEFILLWLLSPLHTF